MVGVPDKLEKLRLILTNRTSLLERGHGSCIADIISVHLPFYHFMLSCLILAEFFTHVRGALFTVAFLSFLPFPPGTCRE